MTLTWLPKIATAILQNTYMKKEQYNINLTNTEITYKKKMLPRRGILR